jgi:hypothetical protein
LEPIPDHWPPEETTEPVRRVAPLFPLPKVFLYPGSLMPLHIFEPRYRQMVEDLLDRPGWLVMSAIVGGHEGEAMGAPPVYEVGGLGEIVKHQRLPDGRYLITLAGIARVRIREVESDRLYRKVEFEAVDEVAPEEDEAEQLSQRLRKAILENSESFLNLPANLPTAPLVDLLLQQLDMPVDELQQVYAEPAVAERARIALAAHDGR